MMKYITSLFAVALSIAAILPAQTVHAQAVLLPSSTYDMGVTMHPKTLAFLERYYGTAIVPYRSQRGRKSTKPEVFNDSYYIDEEDLSPKNLSGFDQNIFQTFERIGMENVGTQYDNDDYAYAQWDLRSLLTHECFEPTRAEISHCIKLFGPYYNLKQSIEDNTIRDRLLLMSEESTIGVLALYDAARQQVLAQEEDDTPQIPSQIVTTGAVGTDGDIDGDTPVFDHSYVYQMRRNATFVWEVCDAKYDLWSEKAGCYLRNQRLITDPDTGLFIDASEAAAFIR